MRLMLKDSPLLEIDENGACQILDFERLPFALRKQRITLVDFVEWASGRTLSIGRSYAKEILNSLRLSQKNRYAVCKACRGLSLEDSYWILQEGDDKKWAEVNLFENPFSLFITEISLSGRNVTYTADAQIKNAIHTPELTTLGASAKGWIRQADGLYLHKVGKYEIPADEILNVIDIEHIPYKRSEESEIHSYLSKERMEWIEGVGEVIVNSRLFTTEDIAMVTFEEFRVFCEAYGLNPYVEAYKELVECIEKGNLDNNSSTAWDGREALDIIMAIYESQIKDGGKVFLPLPSLNSTLNIAKELKAF